MTAQLPGWKETLVEHLVNSYDCRLAAVLFKGGIEFRPSECDDTLRETYYTDAICGAMAGKVADLRARPEVYPSRELHASVPAPVSLQRRA